jgi:polysaccharide deacetylase 2 family uncharacterized protein YibQ
MRFPASLSRGLLLWGGLSLLLLLGTLTTLVDLTGIPKQELLAANKNGQRVVIDPITGTVSGDVPATKHDEAEEESFEVTEEAAEEPPVATDEHAAEAPTEKTDIAAPAEASDAAPETPAKPTAASSVSGPELRTTPEAFTLPKVASSNDSIVAPGAIEITEKHGKTTLPKRGANESATASKLYAKRFQRQEDFSYISIVLLDAGFNAATLSQILKLPHEVTVVFSPYALDPSPQISLLHRAGYETWGMLPVMTSRYPQSDPGPLGLIAGQTGSAPLDRLHQVMSATLGSAGLVLPPDDALSQLPEFGFLLKEIEARGLFLLSTHPSRTVEEITSDKKLQDVIRRADMVLDSTESAAFINSKLAGLKNLAMAQKKLVVVASARPQTIRLIDAWLKKNPLGEEVKLAPLSAMYGSDTPPPPPEVEEKGDHGSGHGGGEEKKESSGGHH